MTFAKPQTPKLQLEQRIAEVIRGASNSAPRSKQVAIGPSEIGDPCVRKLAYKLIQVEKVNNYSDPWAAISGTAIHEWLANAFTKDSSSEWLVETKVKAAPGLAGTVDLFDITNGIVIDHKCVGAASMKARKTDGPTEQQLIQINIYGYGLKQAGYDVKQVALAFYPLGGQLTGLHVWIGDYDEQIALDAIQRQDDIISLLNAIDVEADPNNWSIIPATPSRNCFYCPWHLGGTVEQPLSKGCPGV